MHHHHHNFKIWMENEASMGAAMPEMQPPIVNRGSDTPASDEVKRTGLQPQVDAQDIKTKAKKEQDAMLAIDSDIEHMDNNLPEEDKETPKVNKFKKLWDELKQKWDQVKMSDEEPEDDQSGQGLGNFQDKKYTGMMQDHPNMMPVGQDQGPHGPGIFGQS